MSDTLDGMTVAQLDELIARAQKTREKVAQDDWIRIGGHKVNRNTLEIKWPLTGGTYYKAICEEAMRENHRYNKADMLSIGKLFSEVMYEIAPLEAGGEWAGNNRTK